MPPVRSPLALVQAAAVSHADPSPTALDPLDPPPPSLFDLPKTRSIINRFVERLGGLETLVANLILVPHPTPEMRILLAFALDPQYDRCSLGTLCSRAGLSPGDVFAIYQEVLAAKSAVLAMKQNTEALPEILTSIIESAGAHTETCTRCQGTGTRTTKPRGDKHPEQVTCGDCSGTGVQYLRADREAQKIILDMVGLTKKAAGVVVNQSTQVLNANGAGQPITAISLSTDAIAGALPQLQQAVAGILFGRDAVRKRVPAPAPTDASEALEGAIVTELDPPSLP